MYEVKTITVKVTVDTPRSIWATDDQVYEITVSLDDNDSNSWYEHYPIVPCEIEYQLNRVMGKELFSKMTYFEIMSEYV